jgi:hypothetical protein
VVLLEFQSLLWCHQRRTQESHSLRTEGIHCWKTEEIWLRLARNCCFVSWKSSGIVVQYNDRLKRESWKQINCKTFRFELPGRCSPQSLGTLPMLVSMFCLLWVVLVDYPLNLIG